MSLSCLWFTEPLVSVNLNPPPNLRSFYLFIYFAIIYFFRYLYYQSFSLILPELQWYVIPFDTVPQVLGVSVNFCKKSFSLCSSNWIISITQSSNAWILSSVFSILLLKPIQWLYFRAYFLVIKCVFKNSFYFLLTIPSFSFISNVFFFNFRESSYNTYFRVSVRIIPTFGSFQGSLFLENWVTFSWFFIE